MKVNLEQFSAIDSETIKTIETLASAINSMDKLQIANALRAHDELKEALANNVVRRRKYTSLPRVCIQKNRLLDSYIIRYLLIGACVNSLTAGVGAKPEGGFATELSCAIENKKTGYDEIEKIAESIAKTGKYQLILDILLDLGNRYSLNLSGDITYFLIGECYKANKGEHGRLLEDIVDRLGALEIEPKSPDHIYRQVLLVGTDGTSKGDIDLVVLSNLGVWHIIEAKTGQKKNTGRMRQKARRCLRHQYSFLRQNLGISPELICVYRTNGSNKFKWFRCKKPS